MKSHTSKTPNPDVSVQSKLTHTTFLQREHLSAHHTYDDEMRQYEYAKQGDLRSVEESKRIFQGDSTGQLSNDPIRNAKYLFVASVTLLTRFCIEGGMPSETAYTLSDLYIQKMDEIHALQRIYTLHSEMFHDFTIRMVETRTSKSYSKKVLLSFDYIYLNLHKEITVSDLAKTVDLTPNYLSSLFINEVGMSLSAYIRSKRIEAAENMIKYSSFSLLEISNYLNFSSQSHFSKVFKAQTGYTPTLYRKLFFRHNWSM